MWRFLLGYFGASGGSDAGRRDDVGLGGIIGGGSLGLGAARLLDLSATAAVGCLAAGMLLGWLVVKLGRRIVAGRA